MDKGGARKRKAKDMRATSDVDKAAKSRSHADIEMRRLVTTSVPLGSVHKEVEALVVGVREAGRRLKVIHAKNF